MSVLQKIKNIFKYILPPPTKSFMREMNDLRSHLFSIQEALTCIREENKERSKELASIHEENKSMSKELASIREENKDLSKELASIREENKGLSNELTSIRKENKGLSNELSIIRKENKVLRDELDKVRTEVWNSSWDNYSPGHRAQNYVYLSSIPEERYPEELCKWYYQKTGEILNLTNPRTFNEKIQWMKLYDSTELKTRLADKYLVREWVKEKIGEEYLVPLLGVWDSFDEIDFDKLPDQFALKANHGSGWNIIVKDKASLDREAAKKKFNDWMNSNFAFKEGLELHYMNIPPKIIAEKYIENVEGLKDYRFYCFNGKPTQVWVDIFSGTPNHLRSVYDMEWNLLPLKCAWPDGGELLREKPKTFAKMKEFAKLLCQEFAFVRVDFFEVDGKLYMGEMTFTPMSGIGKFEPAQWNVELGDALILPPKSSIPKRQL